MARTPVLVTKKEVDVPEEVVREEEEVEVQEKKPRQPSKALSVKDKNKMCSILGFLLYLRETGKLDEEEAKKMMEELPIYSTARLQTEFFQQDMFDLKKVEVELWKPMVLNNRNEKKEKKNEKKNKKEEEEPKKKRGGEKKEKKEEEEVLENDETTKTKKDDTKKRGRKAKKQIIQFNDDDVAVDVVLNKVDQLDELLNDILEKEEDNVEDKINENDLDLVLKEMEMELELEEELEEEPIPILEEEPKKKTKKTTISEDAKKNDGAGDGKKYKKTATTKGKKN